MKAMQVCVRAGVFGVALLSLGCQTFCQCTGHPNLTDFDRREVLFAAYVQGASTTAEFLAETGCGIQMLGQLRELGATVKYSDAKLGYALVILPNGKILDAIDIPGLAYASVTRIYKDENFIPTADRKISALPAIELPFPRVATSPPEDEPYFAASEAGLTELWKQHPEADGSGVRVAVVDEGIDLLHPALEKVIEANGQFASKIADIVTSTAPDENSNWVQFGVPIEVKGGTFEAASHTWTAPADGSYRFGIYERKLVMGPERNSHTKTLTIAVGVLWSERHGRVWVDTNGDGSFRDETALADYSKAHDDVGFFGAKDGQDDNRIPFGVKIDPQNHAAYLAIANGGHGTFVAGPLAANRLTGGLFDGAAPNAQLVDVVFGTAMLPSLLKAFARPDVDVINRSGGIARYNDDGRESFERHVLERAIQVYDKPLVSFSAGNNLFLVMDYVSAEMLRRNRRVSPPYLDAMNSFVWFNPEGNVNTVLGPSGSLVTESRYLPIELQWDDGRRHTDDADLVPPAPAGYGIGSNPSPTIPIVSGVLADLISEARHEHVRYSTARLYQALTASARLIPGFPISEQGYGVVNAAGAWDRLMKMATADDPSNPELTSFTIQRKEGGETRDVNGFSVEMSTAGETVDGELWITRRGGYAGGRAYRLALRGDDGTFSLVDERAIFVQGKPTRVHFKATVGSKWHVAFLQLIDAKADAVMEEVPLSVEGPDVPDMVSIGVEKYEATTPPRHEEYGFVQLGSDVQAARFAMSIPFEGPEGIAGRRLPPRLRNPGNEKAPAGEPLDAAHHVGPLESLETLLANTKPGIQEFYWENRGSHAEYETQYDEPPAATVPITGTVTVTKFAVAISKRGDHRLEATNKLAEIEGRLDLYDAKVFSSEEKGDGAHASVDIQRELPAHLTQWRIDVAASSLPENSADVFLLNCTDPKNGCFVAAQQAIGRKGSPLVIEDPKEGNWRIVIRTREPIDKPVEYWVREAMLTPSATLLETSDSKHTNGATWTVELPAKQGDVQYAAFHIQGEPRTGVTQNNTAKNGLDIALTPLDKDAP